MQRAITVGFPIFSDPFSINLPFSSYYLILRLVDNVVVILSDVLAFFAVIRQVWGLWKEKRRLGLHTGEDFATLLLQQGILRFFFVLFVSFTQLVTDYISPQVGVYVGAFQNVYELCNILVNARPFMLPLRLSVILICEFTLDLRRRNTTTRPLPNPSALEFADLNLSSPNNPEVRFRQSILSRLQERIIADMGERNDPVSMGIDAPGQGEPGLETA
ncbi:hypothetical protein Clacol_004536 [Clathrus columnatus]|uniref:Uncharacterized protein n=1 Tax=Clathrus columnatus TaxID=1419009 RepID=A0AAV5ABL6_9AGAM|nr:hypothetical protein Clacol_004536 [Clathrus columnatus]